jgi:hypothetical protein
MKIAMRVLKEIAGVKVGVFKAGSGGKLAKN